MQTEVSLSPALYPYRTLQQRHCTVVVDVLRATTAICAAFKAGAEMIVPLDSLEPLPRYRDMGFALAAERGGKKIGDAQYGNSPTEYLRHDLTGTKLAYSTTNGTVGILAAAGADRVLLGSFANITALADVLSENKEDVVILCSGWQNDPSLEDTLFAGALVQLLIDKCDATPVNDAATMAINLWQCGSSDPFKFCQNATHVHRLKRLGAASDIEFAFKTDTCPVVSQLIDGVLSRIR